LPVIRASNYGQHGLIEKLIFADAAITTSTGIASAMTTSAEATAGTRAELAEAADRMGKEARAL